MPEIVNTDNQSNIEMPVIDPTGCCYDSIRDIKIYNCQLSDNYDCIEGFTEEGTKAKYIKDRSKWFYGSEISKLNLIRFEDKTPEELFRIRSLGGKTARENDKKTKSLNDIAKAMLMTELSTKSINDILGDSKELIGDSKDAGTVMIAKMIQTAMAGSFKAAEFVRDTAGYKPKNEIELQADVMTDSDRSLLEKIDKRLTG